MPSSIKTHFSICADCFDTCGFCSKLNSLLELPASVSSALFPFFNAIYVISTANNNSDNTNPIIKSFLLKKINYLHS